MKKQDVIAIDTYLIDKKNKIPAQLNNQLYCFIAKGYHLANQNEFQRLILQPEAPGELNVLYGLNDDIAGFSRTYRQIIDLGKKRVTTYAAYLYLNPNYNIHPTIEKAGLTEAIKYKLANPEEELIYLAFANNPLTYEFIYQLNSSIYPKPSQRIPDQILTVINAFKKQNGWISTNNHPMVINSPLVPLRSQSPEPQDGVGDLKEFYLSTNPDYLQGNSLLVYLPLNLANINYGLNHQDSIYCHIQKLHHNARNQDGSSLDLRR